MASRFEQQSVRRKFVYFGLVLLLFTGSLLHRKLIVNTQADELMLRDVGRGKADLTDSALRLTLSGVRGVAVTSLWLAAIEKQKRNEWNELEVAVDSLTRLQPHFTSPWFFQGWNLAFNVAVECDRARDKYYYISRGITLLCRGDEKNDPGQAVPPRPWPASPDMRFQVANTYHRKIGQSDENRAMRCLFDLSCIPLAERSPELFSKAGTQQIDLAKFKRFCESHPRFVRRLRERLKGFEEPEAIVRFMADNKDIPARIEARNSLGDDKRLTEFPILPPLDDRARAICEYPDWRSESLASSVEDFDVFVCMRAWHTYAQVPLPDPEVEIDPRKYDRSKYRLPRFTAIVFRGYPARSQVFFGEELQKDGWFDGGGWTITDWFDDRSEKRAVVAGAGSRYNSSQAWNKAFELYDRFATRNSLVMEPTALKKLETEAKHKGTSSAAFKKLMANESARQFRFEDFYQQSKVERTPEAVAARKAIFEVKQKEEAASPHVVKTYREKVLPQWLDLLLRHPEFRQIESIQEDTYELQAKYFEMAQFYYQSQFATLVKVMAYCVPTWPTWPLPGVLPGAAPASGRFHKVWPDVSALGASTAGLLGSANGEGQLLAASTLFPRKTIWPQALLKFAVDEKGIKVMPIRDVEGLLDQLFVLEPASEQGAIKLEALKVTAMTLARQALWPPPPTDLKVPDFALARFAVWPPQAGVDRLKPEIGLGQQAVWPPVNGYVAPGSATSLAGAGVGAVWPRPTFLMLSSAEERRILTLAASHRLPPPDQGWIPLIPSSSITNSRVQIRWMQPRLDTKAPQ